ncbi:MAG: hypothetical protein A3J55_03290 [Candidatus Ryanbacteria bacterium RIFCSPHIGHO2_02_FULL_45_17b]|uniref:Uncharacterized protein n=1 Tax=Candidatus Ryanbacteria bacterium RIFCSPHIGHO2_01_FULL_45_22 TaxID=1802114 RepID=A0A1G2G1T0_9BACT|nr:MAG: hypothetical protein A2719_04490 [Candidatus Ryanbacteria bacterium RIFCSPHIGHO2_01_FULL_45_22]OGZ47486.1 MAG: hypothetical protein A3J55_03290 [Candidatus Ryanbacteria bacterium RIFCSPHIGHO2_02_FULL_45_17b]
MEYIDNCDLTEKEQNVLLAYRNFIRDLEYTLASCLGVEIGFLCIVICPVMEHGNKNINETHWWGGVKIGSISCLFKEFFEMEQAGRLNELYKSIQEGVFEAFQKYFKKEANKYQIFAAKLEHP